MGKCKECGCTCNKCITNDHDVHLHVEIENLKQKLVERESHIVTMETNFLNEANKYPNGEVVALREELLTWQDKYKRLYDAHRRVQRVNQGLEDKLLKLVDVCETEKSVLTKDVATLSQKLAEANYAIKKLSEDNLPQEVQVQVSSHMTNKRKPEEKKLSYEMKSIKVPIPTFPPTAMVYSVPKSPKPDRKTEVEPEAPSVDIVSAAIMAKVLEERQKEKAFAKHCDTCTCSKKLNIVYEITHHTTGTQTGDYNKKSVCLRCNETLLLMNQSPQKMRLVQQDCKKSQINDSIDSFNNVVKVQPNNFLTDCEIVNEISQKCKKPSPKLGLKMEHHHLCKENKSLPTLENYCDSDLSAKEENNLKGPRYCSMRLQSGTRNILLDNAHNNIAPVLYKRHYNNNNKIKREETPTTHESCSSEDFKNASIISENSVQNQQRVAEWVQNNMENVSSAENSQSEPILHRQNQNLNDVDKVKYAEMEENVKRFLFGESEFLKTVEIGKMKYQNYRESGDGGDDRSTRSNSHTETEI